MKTRVMALIVAATMLLTVAAAFNSKEGVQETQMSYLDFKGLLNQSLVQEVTLGDGAYFIGILVDGKQIKVPNPRYDSFKNDLLLAGVQVKENTGGGANAILGATLVIAVLTAMIAGRKQGAMMKFSTVDYQNTVPDITFDQVAGCTEALESMRDLVDFLKMPEAFASYGARIPRGVMLYGPPGTGKTLLAKALAGEAGTPFFAVNGSDFVQVYVGVGASRIRSLFSKAEKAGKAVIFIDEIDAIGKKRDNGNDEREQTLNALLTQMSGFTSHSGIVVLAATNRLDTLDEALLRPGRFDRQIEVGLPDAKGREAILGIHAARLPLSEEVDLSQLAAQTPFFSGARLENLLNEAAILAARRQQGRVTAEDLEKALVHVTAGKELSDRKILAQEKRITSFHEAGHAVASRILMPEITISRITVIPSSRGAAGYTMTVPQDRMFKTKTETENQIAVLLSGRAAEEIAFGEKNVTTGAGNDIKRANELALEYIKQWGSGESGFQMIPSEQQSETASLLLNRLYQRAIELLTVNKAALDALACVLFDAETLNSDEIEQLLLDSRKKTGQIAGSGL